MAEVEAFLMTHLVLGNIIEAQNGHFVECAQELRCPALGQICFKTNRKETAFINGISLGFPFIATYYIPKRLVCSVALLLAGCAQELHCPALGRICFKTKQIKDGLQKRRKSRLSSLRYITQKRLKYWLCVVRWVCVVRF